MADRITYEHRIEFVTIAAAGNAPNTTANPNDFVNGRGGEHDGCLIRRYDVTTTQRVHILNAAYDRPYGERVPHLTPPDVSSWCGVEVAPTNPGGAASR